MIKSWEGCLSDEEQMVLVERPKKVKVRFQQTSGKEFDLACDGLIARIFQHEIDHLDGIIMQTKALEVKKFSDFKTDKEFDAFIELNKD